jgi:hypothetical protein
MTAETLATLPATRTYGALLSAVPGLMTNNSSLGAMTTPFMTMFTAHGGRANEGRVQIDGLPPTRATSLNAHTRRGRPRLGTHSVTEGGLPCVERRTLS